MYGKPGTAYWDSRVSAEDMDDMWNHPDVVKQWSKSGDRRGKVRFSHDAANKPYLSHVELRVWIDIQLNMKVFYFGFTCFFFFKFWMFSLLE